MRPSTFLIVLLLAAGLGLVIVYWLPGRQDADNTGNTNSSTNTAQPSQTNTSSTTTVTANLYLVAIDDQGKAGTKIGCGDSLVNVPVPLTIPQSSSIEMTTAILKAALVKQLSIIDQFYGQSGLYNALYQSRLSLTNATILDGVATVSLSGTLQLGGECDNPRVSSQILGVINQFPAVSSTVVTLNGKTLEEALSLK